MNRNVTVIFVNIGVVFILVGLMTLQPANAATVSHEGTATVKEIEVIVRQ